MVLLTIFTTSNPHTLYFDHPIEKPSYIRLLSASLYNSWHNLKEEAVIYADTPNGTLDAKILPGHYTLDGLVNEFTILKTNNPKFVINAKAHTPIAIMVIHKGNARFSHGLLQTAWAFTTIAYHISPTTNITNHLLRALRPD